MPTTTPPSAPPITPRDRMNALAGLGESPGEQCALFAALIWANDAGELWPSLANWADAAGITPRTLRRSLRALESRGVIERLRATDSITRRTTRYRLVPLAPAEPRGPDASAATPATDTHAPSPGRPVPHAGRDVRKAGPHVPSPGPLVRQTTRNTQRTPNNDAGVVARLDARWILHPHATPERVAWIEREAPAKTNPLGWARRCIEQGWEVPPPTPAEKAASARRKRDEDLAAYDALPLPQRESILREALAACPNLQGYDPASPAVRGAILKVLERPR